MRNALPAALTMIAYGFAVLFVGWLTYRAAPPGANALTALIISIAAALMMTACAVMALMIDSKRRLGMIGIHLGLVLPLLVGLGPAMRLGGSLEKTRAFNAAVEEPGGVIVSRETVSDKLRPHPVGYQAVGLGSIAALSAFAFVTLLLQRPRTPRNEGIDATLRSSVAVTAVDRATTSDPAASTPDERS